MTGAPEFKLTPVYGRVELRSWLEVLPDQRVVGMGMKTTYREDGSIASVDVQPTGVEVLGMGDAGAEPRRWPPLLLLACGFLLGWLLG